jgi:hypothetical protein
LILILVIATVAVFVGLVWLIATYLPWNQLGFSSPSYTPYTPRVEKNCTYPVSYWMEHPELYPPQMVLGEKVYQANEIREALTGADQDLTAQLQMQLVGAFLNISSGADQGLIETTIFQAYSWLVQHSDGSEVSESDLETWSRYYNVLAAYNLGLAGVAPCQVAAAPGFTATTTASAVPTILLTNTPSQTITSTPSESPSPTSQPPTPIYTVEFPFQTPIPTTEPPGGHPPVPTNTLALPPTNTLAPPPSNTPIKTTEAPAPTNTSPPAITATFTQPPQPTPTKTPPPLPTP